MDNRSAFAGGDQGYLRDVQYGDSTKLTARANLHLRYSTAAVRWFPWLATLIEWPGNGRVLDAGCGPAFLWEELAPVVPTGLRVTLSDLSPGMVAEGATRARAAGIDVVDVQAADNEDLPFADGAFDLVFANHTLHHAPDPERGVAELTRVLAPTGVLVTTANGPAHLRELNDIRAELFGEDTRDQTASVFGRVSGRPLLERHLAEVAWHDFPDELRCTDLDDVMAFATSTPPAEHAPPEQLDRLRSAIQARFDAGGGTFRITKEAGVFVSRSPRR